MEALFSDPIARQNMSLASHRRCAEHFHHKHIIGELEALWDELKHDYTPVPVSCDPLSMRVFDAFEHYVTEWIETDRPLVASDFGTLLLASGNRYPLLAGMSDVVDWDTVVSLLKAAATPVTVNDLVTAAACPDWKAKYITAWMLKHDLLQSAETLP